MTRKQPTDKRAGRPAPTTDDLALLANFVHRFDLPDFDRWLSDLKTCPSKSDLIERRARAVEAMWAGDHDSARERFEYLELRRRMLEIAYIAAPIARRDAKRQAGVHKERRPRITAWISQQLDHDPTAKSPALWATAPQWLTEQIGLDRFAKRVTGVRKKRRK